MGLGPRLKLLRQEKGLTQAQFGACFNLAESTISLYESEKRSPDYTILKEFARFFNVSVDFLLGNTDERRPLSFILEDGDPYQAMPACLTGPILLPVLNEVRPGPHHLIYETGPGEEWAWGPDIQKGNYFWVQAKDDSMKGDGILTGDLVLIREQPELEYGEIGLAIAGTEPAVLCRVYKKETSLVLQASNPAYPPHIFSGKTLSQVKVVGKATEIRRRLK